MTQQIFRSKKSTSKNWKSRLKKSFVNFSSGRKNNFLSGIKIRLLCLCRSVRNWLRPFLINFGGHRIVVHRSQDVRGGTCWRGIPPAAAAAVRLEVNQSESCNKSFGLSYRHYLFRSSFLSFFVLSFCLHVSVPFLLSPWLVALITVPCFLSTGHFDRS